MTAADRLVERQQEWRQLPPAQQRRRIQDAITGVVEYSRCRRTRRQRATNDSLFPERSRR